MNQDGVSIRCSAFDLGSGNIAACPAFVFNDEVATGNFRQLLRERARHDVRGSTRCKSDQQGNGLGFGPIALGRCVQAHDSGQGCHAERFQCGDKLLKWFHSCLLFIKSLFLTSFASPNKTQTAPH